MKRQNRSRINPSRVAHAARLEMATVQYGEAVWLETRPALLRWLRELLRLSFPRLEIRANLLDVQLIASALKSALVNVDLPRGIRRALEPMLEDTVLQYGLLPSDPRGAQILTALRDALDADIRSYWATLTDPEQLARKIANARTRGRSGSQIQRDLVLEYGADRWSAERLVRGSFNTAANLAHLKSLERAGFDGKEWYTVRDARVRKPGRRSRFDHVSMDGVRVPIGQPFITPAGSRLMYPCDRSLGAPLGDRVNCRCLVRGVDLEE